jgi:hypothetical protein
MRVSILGFLVLATTMLGACDTSATPSAIDRARELGWEIPVVQLKAFEDGSITFGEVEASAERFERCVAGLGIEIDVSVDRNAGVSWGSDPLSVDEMRLISSCETMHVLATLDVYMEQLRRAEGGS